MSLQSLEMVTPRTYQIMADLFVALPPCTAFNAVVFGKNANRPASEIQDVVHYSASDNAEEDKVKCTYIEVDQVPHTHAVILSKPSWMWGAEMGANEKGVSVGNVPVWTRLNGPSDLKPRLLGTDIVRLALERASTAREAVDIVSSLIASPGQGGSCTEDAGKEGWCFHNSFLIADSTEAWVLETAGSLWAAEKVEGGMRNISNELSIRTKLDLTSPDLIEEAKKIKLYSDDMGPFDFRAVFCAQAQGKDTPDNTSDRYRHGKELLETAVAKDKFTYQNMFEILRNEEKGICMMDECFITAASHVSVLLPESCSAPNVHWFTATPNPATSIYKPFFFGPGAAIGTITQSPPAEAEGGEREKGHTLYRGHKKLIDLLDSHEEKAVTVLEQLKELEKKCTEDVDEIINTYQEASFPKLKQIFQHMATMEINFYL